MESRVCEKVGTEDSCHCDKCRIQKIKRWRVGNRATILPVCCRFRKAYSRKDRAALDELEMILGFGRCVCCGFTLLHLAVSVASKELVDCYLNRNHDVETRTSHGETPLHLACVLEDPWFVEQLLVRKADAVAVDGLGCTPLQICLSLDAPSTAILKILLHHGATPNKLFGRGEVNDESIEKLVKANKRTSAGVMPLYAAVHNGVYADTRRLLQDGACPNSLKCYRRTLLQVACFKKSVLCAMALLEAGADVNDSDLEGRTALHYAVISRSKDLVKLLGSHECDLWARDSDGYTALGMAMLTDRSAVTNALLKQGAWCTESLLLEALERECTDVVLLILGERHFRVHDTKFGQTLLCCAVATSQQRVVDYLVSVGVRVPYDGSDDDDEDSTICPSESAPKRMMEVPRRLFEKPRDCGVTRTMKRPYIPRLHSRAPNCKQTGYSRRAADDSKHRLQTRQKDKRSRCDGTIRASKKFVKPTADQGSSWTRLDCAKITSEKKDPAVPTKVKSFVRALCEKSDAEPRVNENVGSFFRFHCRKESDSKLTTYKGVLFKSSEKKDDNKDATTNVDAFFKFYKLCVM